MSFTSFSTGDNLSPIHCLLPSDLLLLNISLLTKEVLLWCSFGAPLVFDWKRLLLPLKKATYG